MNMQIVSVRCKEGVLVGSRRTTKNILAREMDSVEPAELGPMHGVVASVGGKSWFIPESTILEVVVDRIEESRTKRRSAA
jgi:hypothetical protein